MSDRRPLAVVLDSGCGLGCAPSEGCDRGHGGSSASDLSQRMVQRAGAFGL